MKENRKLLKEVLKDIQHDMTDEEVLNLLTDSKISESPTAEKYTLGQRAADAIAKFAGSWAFIFAFTGVLILFPLHFLGSRSMADWIWSRQSENLTFISSSGARLRFRKLCVFPGFFKIDGKYIDFDLMALELTR